MEIGYGGIGYLDSAVCCANCDHEFTYQKTVVVHLRDMEDGPGKAVEVNRDGVLERRLPKDSKLWAGRRDDIVIALDCENCDEPSELVIQQHKGQTFVFVRSAINKNRNFDVPL